MNNQPAAPPLPEDSELDALVAHYLSSHTAFFENHPELLIALRIPHPSGEATSLIEHQVRLLRTQLATERKRLTHLLSRAREYETLAARLHNLALQLLSINDPRQLCCLLRDGLLREFHADAVTLKLIPLDAAEPDARDPLTAAFGAFLDRERTLCGPLDPEQRTLLFGENGAGILAAALIPIHADGHSGVLAIGSADPERFLPDMGTDLLDRLGEMVSYKLKAVPLAPCDHF